MDGVERQGSYTYRSLWSIWFSLDRLATRLFSESNVRKLLTQFSFSFFSSTCMSVVLESESRLEFHLGSYHEHNLGWKLSSLWKMHERVLEHDFPQKNKLRINIAFLWELANDFSLHHGFSNNIILGWITEIKGRKERSRPAQGGKLHGKICWTS